MDQSTPGPPVFHCLLEFGQIHDDSFGNTVQPSCPLSSPSLPFTLCQHQGLFQGVFSWDGQIIGASASWSVILSHAHHNQQCNLIVANQGWLQLNCTMSWRKSTQGCFPSERIGFFSLQSRGLSRVSSSTTIHKHQFFGSQPSLWSSSHFHTSQLEKP